MSDFFKANTLASMDNISDPIFIIAKINGLFRFSEQDQKDLKKKEKTRLKKALFLIGCNLITF